MFTEMWKVLLYSHYLKKLYTYIKVYTVVLESLHSCLAYYVMHSSPHFSSWIAPITINVTQYE